MSAPDPADPFAAVLPPGRYGATGADPVHIAARRCTIVRLATRRGQTDVLAAAIRGAFGLDLPPPGHAARSGDIAALWLQPETWLLVTPRGAEGASARTVKVACGNAGSVIDETHGRGVLTVSGAQARAVFGRICRIDLHPRNFGPGRVAATPIAELGCLLYQRDDTPGFDLIVSSSTAGWFADALTHAAAGVGYEIA